MRNGDLSPVTLHLSGGVDFEAVSAVLVGITGD